MMRSKKQLAIATTVVLLSVIFFVSFLLTLTASADTANKPLNVRVDFPSSGGGNSGGGGGPPGGCNGPCPGDPPPVISNVASSTANTTAQVSWSATDNAGIAGNNFVFGTDTSYGGPNVTVSGLGPYSASLSGLTSGTVYYFKISATDTANQTTVFTAAFTTTGAAPPPGPDVTPPVLSPVQVVVGFTTSSISFTTDEDAQSQIDYGLTSSYGSKVTDGSLITNHSFLLTNLLPNSTYHYRVSATDATGNTANTLDATFTTLKDTVPPPDVSDLQLTPSATTLTLSWVNPSLAGTPDFSGVTIRRSTSGFPTDQTDGISVYTDTGQTFIDSEVIPEVMYFYTVCTFDTSLNYSCGAIVSGKTNPAVPTGPEICGNGVDDNSDGLTDCQDPVCASVPACGAPSGQEICGNGVDDDNNGLIDCQDVACSSLPQCGGAAEICGNGVDDDNNGLTDCQDPVCASSPQCTSGQEICSNGVDDDNNGLIDCQDVACANSPECGSVQEICGNGVDDDNNGLIDCADSVCMAFSGCGPEIPVEVKPKEPVVANQAAFTLNQLLFFTAGRKLHLVINDNAVTGLAGYGLTVGIPHAVLPALLDQATLQIDNALHRFTFDIDSDTYYADASFPAIGRHTAILQIAYLGGKTDSLEFLISSQPYGDVLSNKKRLNNASITLFSEDGTRVPLEKWDQSNPFITNVNGSYGWMVPNGRYYIVASRTGFYDRPTPAFEINNNIVNQSLELVGRPLSIRDSIKPGAPLTENIGRVAKAVAAQANALSQVALQRLEVVKANPEVQRTAANVVAPTVVAVTAVGTVTLISFADLLPFLRLLFLQPLLLLGRRKREGWGEVYNALNKLPVDLATLRLVDAATSRVLQTKVTDQKGRYAFVANPGKYRIQVNKKDFVFPSKLLEGFHSDGRRADIYHGEIIEVGEKYAVITANIPLDPVGEHTRPIRLRWSRFGRWLQVAVSWFGLGITAVSFYFAPRWYVGVLLGVHVLLFFVFRRLAIPPKIKSWGIVYDDTTRHPVGRVITRLFNSQFNKLVATQITDTSGRYYFLAGDNPYYVTYEHPEYEQHRTDIIDLSGKEAENITLDVHLKSRKNGTESTPTPLTAED